MLKTRSFNKLSIKYICIFLFILLIPIITSTNVFSEQIVTFSGTESEFDVEVKNGRIYGNITYPKVHDINTPVIIIVSDLGNVDRNGNIYNITENNYYKNLAYQLSNNGFITLRYDKRGIGESSNLVDNKTPTISQHKDDLINIVNYINQKMGRKEKRIFLLGHDEGNLIVSITAQKRNFSGLIFYSFQAIKQEDIIKERLLKDSNNLYIEGTLKDKDILVDIYNDLVRSIENNLEFTVKDKNIPKRYKNLFLSLYFQKEYSKELLTLMPIKLIENQNSPVFIVNGKKDDRLTEKGINKLQDYNNQRKN
ncbi:MAG: alpha/beta hydrolase [Halanaerobiales bacterium]|nr:alpha/beta hydrolase [Halanaerobiales bacterium]